MFRRLNVFVLVLACAFAPALPAFEAVLTAPADCCCGGNHCCSPAECPPPASARPAASTVVSVAEVSRAAAPRTAARLARVLFAFVSAAPAAPALRGDLAAVLAPAASVPLFTAHCSLRL